MGGKMPLKSLKNSLFLPWKIDEKHFFIKKIWSSE